MEALYTILGWLLGILSPGIIGHITNQYRKKSLQKLITNELRDLKKRLTLIPFTIRSGYGDINKNLITWTTEQMKDIGDHKEEDEFKNYYEKMISENKGDLTNFLKLCNTSKLRDNPSFHFKKMNIVSIDYGILNFELLDEGLTKKILDIKFHINAFNEELRATNDFLKMTFDSSISETNHKIVTEEIKKKNLIISEKSIQIVNKINNILY